MLLCPRPSCARFVPTWLFGFTSALVNTTFFIHILFLVDGNAGGHTRHHLRVKGNGMEGLVRRRLILYLKAFFFQGMRRHVGVLGVPRYLELIKLTLIHIMSRATFKVHVVYGSECFPACRGLTFMKRFSSRSATRLHCGT